MIWKMPPLVAGLVFLTGATAVMGGAMAYRAGAVRVSVDQDRPGGDHVHLLVPAVVISPAMHLVPEEALRGHAKEIQPWLPAVRIAARELAKSPDGVLVEVIDPKEHVVIRNQGGSLVIDVKSPDERVHVKVPLRTLQSVAEKLEAGTPPS